MLLTFGRPPRQTEYNAGVLGSMQALDRWAITTGSRFEEMASYSRALVEGEWAFVSGTAGFDSATGAFPDDPEQQTRLALGQISDALRKAGAKLADIVRVRVYLGKRDYVMPVSRILGQTFSEPRPTNTTIVCEFADPWIQVETEVTALVCGGTTRPDGAP